MFILVAFSKPWALIHLLFKDEKTLSNMTNMKSNKDNNNSAETLSNDY